MKEPIWTKIKYIDLFSKPISLTYNGRENFYSNQGTLITFCFLVWFFIQAAISTLEQLKQPVKTTASSNSLVEGQMASLLDDQVNLFGFGFTEELPAEIGHMQASFIQKSDGVKTNTPLSLKECDGELFEQHRWLTCLDTKEINMQGDVWSEQFDYVQLDFVPCTIPSAESECLDKEAQFLWLQQLSNVRVYLYMNQDYLYYAEYL